MKIIFICGSLEPGNDGVGDYVRKLSLELIRRGHQIKALAIHDFYIQSEFHDEIEVHGLVLPVLRLPAIMSKKNRAIIAQKWISDFNPSWLSLQFVVFAYNNRGMPLGFGKWVHNIGSAEKWHMMFHEIWQGESKTDTFKQRFLGSIQVAIIKNIVKKIKPQFFSTSNTYYKKCLTAIGVSPTLIPVFSNMPIGNSSDQVLMCKLPIDVMINRQDYIIGSFFGTIHYNSYLGKSFEKVQEMARAVNKKLVITHIGNPNGLSVLWSHINISGNDFIHSFGYQSAKDIADFFCQIDIGLSTNPKILYEKSGSIAAMLNNNLPVILLRKSFEHDDRKLIFIEEIQDIKNITDFIGQLKNFGHTFEVSFTAEKYEQLLS